MVEISLLYPRVRTEIYWGRFTLTRFFAFGCYHDSTQTTLGQMQLLSIYTFHQLHHYLIRIVRIRTDCLFDRFGV